MHQALMLSDLLLQERLEQLLAFFRQLVLHYLSGILRIRCGHVHVETASKCGETLCFSQVTDP